METEKKQVFSVELEPLQVACWVCSHAHAFDWWPSRPEPENWFTKMRCGTCDALLFPEVM